MEDFNVAGRTAVITGASRGIGLAVVQKLAQHGAHHLKQPLTKLYSAPP